MPVDEILLRRFFENKCTTKERQLVVDWLSNPENSLVAKEFMQHQWDRLGPGDDPLQFDVEKSLEKTREKIFPERHSRDRGHVTPMRSPSWVYRIAAVFIGMIILFGSRLIFVSDVPGRDARHAMNLQAVKAPSDQIIRKVLADGTKIWLNGQSTIEFPTTFSKDSIREVFLNGEAFFEVAHNKEKPFIVHTSSIDIKVLGTSFNVKAYSNEKTIETTLLKGKVRIEPQPDAGGRAVAGVELKPNQRAVFNKGSKMIDIEEVNADSTASWKQKRMVFDRESLDNVITQLERWYDIKIHVDNRGELDCKLTATIENESLEDVLRLMELSQSHKIEYKIVGRDVFIEGSLCRPDQDK